MKGRESGMPGKEAWEGFFEPARLLKVMGLGRHVENVVEFGCGYGTFTIPAARLVSGTVYAIDIDAECIRMTQQEAKRQGIKASKFIERDFIENGTGLEDSSVDYAMLFNILHVEHPLGLLQEARRVLKPDGRVGIVHWNYDPATPRGPSMDIRPTPQQCIQWAQASGFSSPEQLDLPPYHYGIILRKGSKLEPT